MLNANTLKSVPCFEADDAVSDCCAEWLVVDSRAVRALQGPVGVRDVESESEFEGT